ncbi:MAG: hypothetical protein ACRYF3_04465 [Janthinobacterium lividum]
MAASIPELTGALVEDPSMSGDCCTQLTDHVQDQDGIYPSTALTSWTWPGLAQPSSALPRPRRVDHPPAETPPS